MRAKERVLPFEINGVLTLLALFLVPVLTCLGAQIRIHLPYTPVPVTLQTFFVLFLAAAFPYRISAAGQGLYILGGILGLPFFANGLAGPMGLLHPTGGYLIGFVLASWFIGFFIRKMKRHTFSRIFLLLTAGSLIYFLTGVLRLSFIFGPVRAFFLGFWPFFIGDVLKAAIAALLILRIKRENI